MNRFVRAVLILVLAMAGSLLATAPAAQAANAASCRGEVWSTSKSGGQVHLTYRLWCAKTVDELHVTAGIGGGKYGETARNHNDCYDTYYCYVSVSVKDYAGSQLYYFNWVHGVWPSSFTFVRDRTGNNVECNREMSCQTASAYY
jgi:hypothetical protein